MEINLKTQKQPRRSSLELLRIICMIFIVAHHFGVHGKYGDMQMSTFNSFIVYLLSAGGKLGVNVYVLISGYFLVNSKFNLRRIINTVGLTVFYSMTIYLAFACFMPDFGFSLYEFVRSMLVVKHNAYWFVTCYVAMVLLSPFINKLLHALDRREHLILIALLVAMQVSIPHFGTYIGFSNVGWFITLYVIAGYMRLHPEKLLESKRVTGIASLILCAVVGLWETATTLTSIICLLASVVLFAFFNNLPIGTNRIINLISKATFGVYLIHDNIIVREYIWDDLLRCPMHAGYDSFWIFSALAVIAVYVGCTLIELLRQVLTRVVLNLADSLISKRKSA